MASLRWDGTNWITVVLMVTIAYAFVGLIRSVIVGNLPSTSQ